MTAPVPETSESTSDRLRQVISTYIHLIARTLRAYGVVEADVDDGIQQVCLVFSNKMLQVVPGAERAYLFRTAHRIAYRLRRDRGRRREVAEDQASDETDGQASPEHLTDQREAFDVLSKILDGMDEDLRAVFILYEVEEMTMAAIANALELPAGTVASRLRRAREQFKARRARCNRQQRGSRVGPRHE